MTDRPHSQLPADYRDLAELYREVCAERDALVEQLEAEQQRRLQAVSLIPYEGWNALPRETRLRLTDGLAPVRPVPNPASEPKGDS